MAMRRSRYIPSGPMPEFFHSPPRSKKNWHDTDDKWIDQKLNRLSSQNRLSACEMYRGWFLSSGRQKANERLAQFVLEHGISKREYQKAKLAAKGDMEKLNKKIEALKKMKPQRKGIFDF